MPPDRWQRSRDEHIHRDRSSAAVDDRQLESSRASARQRDDDHSGFPSKSRRIDDTSDDRGASASASTGPRRTDSGRDGTMPALTIRGIASNQRAASPPKQAANDTNSNDPRARSPDLFDRISRRRDDDHGSGRVRTDGTLRSRLEAESSRADTLPPSRRPATKLAPRGRYDDDGRRVDDDAGSSGNRDRRATKASDDAPTSPRKRTVHSRSARDRSISPAAGRRHYRADDDDSDSRFNTDWRTRRARRSPSPSYRDHDRDRKREHHRPSSRYDRYERQRSPLRGSDRYAPESRHSAQSARRAPSADRDEHGDSPHPRSRHDGAAPSRRNRSPSPSRSDTSTRSRHRDVDQDTARRTARRWEDDDRDIDTKARDRPARWRLNDADRDKDKDKDKGRDADGVRARRYRDRDVDDDRARKDNRRDERGARTPPRRTDDGTERAQVLSRKSNMDGTQPPTGPRRQDEAVNQRSVRGGGWQTVRAGSRPERNGGKPSTIDAPNVPRNDRNASRPNEPDDARRVEADESTATATAAVVAAEPARAEPGEAYESMHQVGEGTYGQVFKARSERTGALVALKKIRMDSEKDGFPVTAMREIRLLQALRHENIVRLHEIMVTRGSIYMVFEYMEHDLNGILAHTSVEFTPAHVKSLAWQLFCALEYLHGKAVLHRDLKGSNLLLNNEGRLKLADFGLARTYAKRSRKERGGGDYTNRVVTLWYRPPELLFGETRYASEVDMWGAGCIFLELWLKKPVFTGDSEIAQVTAITDILGPVTSQNWPGVERLGWYEMVKPIALPSTSTSVSVSVEGEGKGEGEGEGEEKDYIHHHFGRLMPESALDLVRGLLMYNVSQRWSAKQALSSSYFHQPPAPQPPARILSQLQGEWHEYESRRAKRSQKSTLPPPPPPPSSSTNTNPVFPIPQ